MEKKSFGADVFKIKQYGHVGTAGLAHLRYQWKQSNIQVVSTMKSPNFTLRRIIEQCLFYALTFVFLLIVLFICFSACADGVKWYKILWFPIIVMVPCIIVCVYYGVWRIDVSDNSICFCRFGKNKLRFTLTDIQSVVFISRLRGSELQITLRNGTKVFIPTLCYNFKAFYRYIRAHFSIVYR